MPQSGDQSPFRGAVGDLITLKANQDRRSTHVPIFGGYTGSEIADASFNSRRLSTSDRCMPGPGFRSNKLPRQVYGVLYLVTSERIGDHVRVMTPTGEIAYADVKEYEWKVRSRDRK